jgi:hypothetical protein
MRDKKKNRRLGGMRMTSIGDVVNCAQTLASLVEVNDALTIMGLRIDDLHNAIDAGEIDRDSCSPFNPPPDAGNRAHGTTVRVLREIYVPQGWTSRNHLNLSTIASPSDEIEMAVGSGDDATGNPYRTPLSKYPKGDLVIVEVEANRRQLLLFRSTAARAAQPTGRITWVLLRYRQDEIVHCELSIPTGIAHDKRVVFEGTRIILPDLDLNPGGGGRIKSHDDGPSSVDVTVLRRQA